MRLSIPVTALLLSLASCVAPSRQAPPPPPQQAPSVPATPAPQPNANWSDLHVSPGEWSYPQEGSGSAAQYVNRSRMTDLFIRCGKSLRRIQIARAGRERKRVSQGQRVARGGRPG